MSYAKHEQARGDAAKIRISEETTKCFRLFLRLDSRKTQTNEKAKTKKKSQCIYLIMNGLRVSLYLVKIVFRLFLGK
jgi:hypothetical protein